MADELQGKRIAMNHDIDKVHDEGTTARVAS